eukprot:IDg9058t1
MWAEYQKLESNEEKEQFSKTRRPFVNSIEAHIETREHVRILVNAPIVDTVVGGFLLHPDDIRSVIRKLALKLFKKLYEPSISDEVEKRDVNEVVIKTRRHFDLCIKFISLGASFRMASRLIYCTQAESGIAMYGGCSEIVASSYTSILYADALQILSDVLRETSTLRAPHWREYVRCAAEVPRRRLFGHVEKKCVVVSTDGTRNMVGQVIGIVTRIQQTCLPGMLRVWCGLHQLDLVMQRVFKLSFEEQFYSTLT